MGLPLTLAQLLPAFDSLEPQVALHNVLCVATGSRCYILKALPTPVFYRPSPGFELLFNYYTSDTTGYSDHLSSTARS